MTDVRSLALRRVHGTHNAFFLLDARDDAGLAELPFASVATRVARSAEGRCDGLLVVLDDATALARMRMFNPDGTEAEMCGNGMRCVARHLVADGAPDRFIVASGAGPIACDVTRRDPFEVRLGMGVPAIAPSDERIDGPDGTISYRFVSLGNPHAIVTLRDPEALAEFDIAELAARFAADARFPLGVNVHAIAPLEARRIAVRHFERGAGETQACGTGAVASAVTAIARGLASSPVTVEVPGGTLTVTWRPGGEATLAGPAVDDGATSLPLSFA